MRQRRYIYWQRILCFKQGYSERGTLYGGCEGSLREEIYKIREIVKCKVKDKSLK